MITRFALFEGTLHPGKTEAFRAAVLDRLVPLWRQFPGNLDVKVMFSDHVGLRLEGRIFSTFMDDDDDFYCSRDYDYDDCDFDDDFFFQTQAKAGLVFAF